MPPAPVEIVGKKKVRQQKQDYTTKLENNFLFQAADAVENIKSIGHKNNLLKFRVKLIDFFIPQHSFLNSSKPLCR